MCNLYSVTKGQQAIRELARAMQDRTGNLPPLPGIFPDYPAPIVRNHPDGRELAMARWGMPSPAFALEGKKCDPGVTNVRNTKSSHWRRWLGVESRCLVPFTSFAEHEVLPNGSRPPVWFAFDDSRPLAFFAGTGLPLIVVITSIGVSVGKMRPENAAALVAAGILSVVLYPLLGLRGLRRAGVVDEESTVVERPIAGDEL